MGDELMDKREKSIFDVGEWLLAERLSNNIAEIEQVYQESPKTCSTAFLEAIQALLEQVAIAREQTDKGPLRYICVSFLQSSLYTGNYQLRVDAYDERLFGDLSDTHVHWSPDFIFRYIHDDMAHFRKYIRGHVLRVYEVEIMTFFARYIQHYFHIAKEFIPELMKSIVPADIFGEQKLTVTFGGYMDQIVVLYETE